VSVDARLLEDSAEELFEDAPCGYLSTGLDGTIVQVNRTFERWTGRSREDLLEQVRFQELLTAGGRIYHETHYAPLLQMQGSVQEIAVDIMRVDGSVLPALINSVVRRDEAGRPRVIRTTVFDATQRRRYERELLAASHREHDIAQTLQQSLLSGQLPTSPAMQLEVFYGPGARGLEVGGDWYDAFWVEDQRTVGLVVGDVVGRGLGAAATMGQMRSAVRALATLKLPPGRLLEALDEYSERHDVGRMSTLVYGELNLLSRELRFACAGHPPPLLHEPGHRPQYLWGGRSTPVNALGEPLAREDCTVTLAVGSVLLLYTDGLIEHRVRPADIGMQQLAGLVRTHEEQPLPEMVDRVVRVLHDHADSDDRCLAVVRLCR
jgi:sigma-B regulation protein RsbU (phosphoserine phosphatase)